MSVFKYNLPRVCSTYIKTYKHTCLQTIIKGNLVKSFWEQSKMRFLSKFYWIIIWSKVFLYSAFRRKKCAVASDLMSVCLCLFNLRITHPREVSLLGGGLIGGWEGVGQIQGCSLFNQAIKEGARAKKSKFLVIFWTKSYLIVSLI